MLIVYQEIARALTSVTKTSWDHVLVLIRRALHILNLYHLWLVPAVLLWLYRAFLRTWQTVLRTVDFRFLCLLVLTRIPLRWRVNGIGQQRTVVDSVGRSRVTLLLLLVILILNYGKRFQIGYRKELNVMTSIFTLIKLCLAVILCVKLVVRRSRVRLYEVWGVFLADTLTLPLIVFVDNY